MANYNNKLQTNNTELQSILDDKNALPEVGGGGDSGGSLETVAITFTNPISGGNEPYGGIPICYTDEYGVAHQETVMDNLPYTIYPIKNSIVFLRAEIGNSMADWLLPNSGSGAKCFIASKDCAIQPLDL